MSPVWSPQEIADRARFMRQEVRDAKCEMDGSYVRANSAFLARERLMQLLGMSELQAIVDHNEAIAAVRKMP